LRPAALANECMLCGVKTLCLGGDLDNEQILGLAGLVVERKKVPRGDVIYEEGARFTNLFTVASGALKSVVRLEDSAKRIADLSFRGDLVGFAGAYSGIYTETQIALDNCIVCVIPYQHLVEYIQQDRMVGRQFHRLVSRIMAQRQQATIYTISSSAELRVSGFLLWFSERLAERRQQPTEFSLPVSRIDLATFVGLRVETVSRAFTRLRELCLIETNGRKIRITDLYALRRLHTALQNAPPNDG
jgi:CRP/FNR family transcriptional regulator, anaerobic regulatory protein